MSIVNRKISSAMITDCSVSAVDDLLKSLFELEGKEAAKILNKDRLKLKNRNVSPSNADVKQNFQTK